MLVSIDGACSSEVARGPGFGDRGRARGKEERELYSHRRNGLLESGGYYIMLESRWGLGIAEARWSSLRV